MKNLINIIVIPIAAISAIIAITAVINYIALPVFMVSVMVLLSNNQEVL